MVIARIAQEWCQWPGRSAPREVGTPQETFRLVVPQFLPRIVAE
jgi:hypothetical protein